MYQDFFSNKKVLITGHTGFKGSWLSIWLNALNAEVYGLSIDKVSNPSNYEVSKVSSFTEEFFVDIRDYETTDKIIKQTEPDVIFHLAAQALVAESYSNPIETIQTNALGSANILESLRSYNKKIAVVMITSDKAYDNVEWVWGYRETDTLGGKDPYSASKGMAELAIKSYLNSFILNKKENINIGIARAGNVIGGGDWAENRLVPDSMKAWSCGEEVLVRNPNSTRPWQHVLEPLSGYMLLAKKLYENDSINGEAFNFGPSLEHNYSVVDLLKEMTKYWENISWRDISEDNSFFHEAGLLKLNCDKALSYLNWQSVLTFQETVKLTVEWYRSFYAKDARIDELALSQIKEYANIAKQKNADWLL